MRIQRKTLTKRITPSGELRISSPELEEFARQHPGRSVVIRVELLPIPPSQKSFAYYWKVVVPEMQRAFYEKGYVLTMEATEKALRQISPVMQDARWEDGKLRTRTKELDEIDAAELNEMIEYLKIYAAENLDCYIEEPEYV